LATRWNDHNLVDTNRPLTTSITMHAFTRVQSLLTSTLPHLAIVCMYRPAGAGMAQVDHSTTQMQVRAKLAILKQPRCKRLRRRTHVAKTNLLHRVRS